MSNQGAALKIQRAGPAGIDVLVDQAQEETLHLEFKTLSADTTLIRDDRKMLAKAICGLSNAEGGLLIVGIETKKIDGVDTAFKKRPIKNLDRYRRLVAAALPEMLSPQHNGISLIVIPCDPDESQGYLLIEVPASDDRPHMSVSERRYFRRGSDGTRVLDHSEIRELMFATREGLLKIELNLRLGSSTADLRYSLQLVLTLRNLGKVPVVAPYIRIRNPGWNIGANLPNVTGRHAAEGSYGFYATRDVLIHVEDEIGFADHATGLDFRRTGHYDLRSAISTVRGGNLPHAYQMMPFGEMSGFAARDRPVSVSGFFGAENAIAKPFDFRIGKQELFELFCSEPSIAKQI